MASVIDSGDFVTIDSGGLTHFVAKNDATIKLANNTGMITFYDDQREICSIHWQDFTAPTGVDALTVTSAIAAIVTDPTGGGGIIPGVQDKCYELGITLGAEAGSSVEQFLISKSNINDNLEHDLWECPADAFFPTIDSLVYISSTSNNDYPGGSGAGVIQISGWKSDGTPVNDTILLNGQTVVASTETFYRMGICQVVFSGASERNEGDIYIGADPSPTSGINSQPVAFIKSNTGQARPCYVHSPAGQNLAIYDLRMISQTQGNENVHTEFRTYVRLPDGTNTEDCSFLGMNEIILDGGGKPVAVLPGGIHLDIVFKVRRINTDGYENFAQVTGYGYRIKQ